MPEDTSAPAPLPEDFRLERDRAEAMLPWAANGSLAESDRAWLDEWLAANEAVHPEVVASMRSELEWLQRTAKDVRSNVGAQDPEQGLDVLLRRIADERASARQAPDRWGRVRDWLVGHGPQLAVACALLVLAQASTLLMMNRGGSELDPLGGGPGVVEVKGTVLLKVAFVPQASEGDIRQLLQATNTRIVDGPSALGLYLLRVKSEDAQEAIRRMTEQAQVIESIQRIE